MKEVKIMLFGKIRTATRIGSMRLIDGMPVEQFLKTLSPDELAQAAEVGWNVASDPQKSPTVMFNEIHQRKHN